MKKFAVLLAVIFVTAGSAQARISSSKDQLLPHLRPFPDLLRRFSQKNLRMPQHGKSPRTASSALSVWMVLPHLRRRVPAVTAISGQSC